ncbi:MAG: tetratricopeptide repeat protein, partial [Rhodospirillales bacterium]|nr:tetratricopeptide repeat protein [Rhodospirillales bacterium]
MHISRGHILAGQKFRKAGVVALTMMLTSCGVAQNGGSMLDFKFWESGGIFQGNNAELGIAEMAKGNYLAAERYFRDALNANPRDVHALLGAAILYHNTGQLVRAREMYEAVLAIRPPDSEQFINLNDISTHPVSQV